MLKYNIYCDESCHLEHSLEQFMVLGAITCSREAKAEIFSRIREIKQDHGVNTSELKWTHISKTKLILYKDIIDYFFDKQDLNFRAVFLDKTKLDHSKYGHTHDDFYYIIYFNLLKRIVDTNSRYNIYLDIKDTLGSEKVRKLKEVLCTSVYDFDQRMIETIQTVRSHEVALLQVVDIIIGAIQYANRYPQGGKSEAKNFIVEHIKKKTGLTLLKSTYPGTTKFNLFLWGGN